MRFTLAAAMTLAASVAMVATRSVPHKFSVGRTQRELK